MTSHIFVQTTLRYPPTIKRIFGHLEGLWGVSGDAFTETVSLVYSTFNKKDMMKYITKLFW